MPPSKGMEQAELKEFFQQKKLTGCLYLIWFCATNNFTAVIYSAYAFVKERHF
jgi:hypothetical protein